MVTFQDSSVGVVAEGTYKTYVAPTRHIEFLDETLNFNKQIKQGQGLRVGDRFPSVGYGHGAIAVVEVFRVIDPHRSVNGREKKEGE